VPETDIDIFVRVLLRLQDESLAGSADALELLWWAGFNTSTLLLEIQVRGSHEARQALKTVAAKHANWPWIATFTDGPRMRKALREIGLGKKLTYDPESQVKSDRLTKLARDLLDHVSFVGAVLAAHQKKEITTRPRLPMYSRPASRLPPFSQATLSQWWQVISKVFDRWFPDPSSVPWMRAIVRNGVSTKGVRSVIKRRLRQKLAGLAPKC
jgi:hypothetical protein